MAAIKVAITGACGRMGKRLIALAKSDKAFELVAAIDRPDCEELRATREKSPASVLSACRSLSIFVRRRMF